MELCTCKKLTFQYATQSKPAIQDISLQIQQGEFIVICGQSGCGKTTLLRHFKPTLQPYGDRSGEVLFEGSSIEQLSPTDMAMHIGYVMQHVDHQIVTDKVWHELAFGLENVGCPPNEMKRKIAEMATFFGMEHWLHKETDSLSGGQKQMLNLASIMLLQPKLLLLDEATSQLDPIAAKEFLHMLQQINTEFGTTIIMAEHHLEEVFSIADRIIVMENGKILCQNKPERIAFDMESIHKRHPMLETFPTAIRLYQQTRFDERYPIKVKEARQYLSKYCTPCVNKIIKEQHPQSNETLYQLKDIFFRYDVHGDDVLKGVQLTIKKQEIVAILGANGAGKSTLLNILCGIYKPYRGSVYYENKDIVKQKHYALLERIAYVPQDTSTMFVKDEIVEDLLTLCNHQKDKENAKKRMQKWISAFHLEDLLHQHPYDVSGGEQQRIALCKALIRDVDVLLLDEPTKGLDSFMKEEFAYILQQLQEEGLTIIMVSHDIEFTARHTTRVALLFDGVIMAQDHPRAFFKGNQFYTTVAHRIAKDFYDDAITCEEVIEQCLTHIK